MLVALVMVLWYAGRVVVVLVVVVAGGLLWEVGRVVGCEARALVWS